VRPQPHRESRTCEFDSVVLLCSEDEDGSSVLTRRLSTSTLAQHTSSAALSRSYSGRSLHDNDPEKTWPSLPHVKGPLLLLRSRTSLPIVPAATVNTGSESAKTA
jgi:hypothetical protein